MPEISIIVPVYKVEKYIHRCIESILAQTFRDFELILVDDGSPDNCGKICDEYAFKDSRVLVIHQENGGLSVARNAGVDRAQGSYVCFVDSDDMISPEYCRVLLDLLRDTGYDFSFCGVQRFPDGTEPSGDESGETGKVSIPQYTRMQLERHTEFGVWNKMYRRELLYKIRFMPGKLHEDVIFSADMLKTLHGNAVYTTRKLYYYRQRQGSIVANHAMRCSPDRVFAGEYLLQAVEAVSPELTDMALRYAVEYPFMFVDPIYVKGKFGENKAFLDRIQRFLRDHIEQYRRRNIFSGTQTMRMALFAKSKFCYGFNAYARLLRVYLYHIIGKDAYADGHGI